jgi:DNA polymerase-4
VRQYGDRPEIKSVSRGRTFKRDLVEVGEIRTALTVLSDEVAQELRRHNLKGEVVSVQIRRPDMSIISRQTGLEHYTFLQREIQEEAFNLLTRNWRIGDPIRALTVGVGRLAHADEVVEQIGMFDNLSSTVVLKPGEGSKQLYTRSREKQEKLETLMDELRGKYGQKSITLGYQENKDIGIVRGDGRR